ncbi:hypothetical protein V6Z12_A12G028600 [Gossypium hirsutum]
MIAKTSFRIPAARIDRRVKGSLSKENLPTLHLSQNTESVIYVFKNFHYCHCMQAFSHCLDQILVIFCPEKKTTQPQVPQFLSQNSRLNETRHAHRKNKRLGHFWC